MAKQTKKKIKKAKAICPYADTPFDFRKNFKALSKYTDELKAVAKETTNEESNLIVVHQIYHSI